MNPTSPAANNEKFRRDINGLRAWAVVAVMLYHFNIPGITGGFIGVDIFFVISGLLMTKIIIEDLEKKKVKPTVRCYGASTWQGRSESSQRY
ncbi:acyltransferase [Pseudomonas chlororaphis subsp. piscium]|nr:acyltransferase [Pseudomonas chlororaphis subsp. piscium]